MTRPSILIIGCGLMGTSLALAWRQFHGDWVIDGVDTNPAVLVEAAGLGVFDTLHRQMPSAHAAQYDWAVLAIPTDAAERLLPDAVRCASLVADLCSIKGPICKTATSLGLEDRFVPTHPMAGNSGTGPRYADATLFQRRPWIFLDGWKRSEELERLIGPFGSRPIRVPSAAFHDASMALVSHGIHLMSNAAMLAAAGDDALPHEVVGQLSGPGFEDITRLAESDDAFWVPTLLANRHAVQRYVARAIEALGEMERALEDENAEALHSILRRAKTAKKRFRAYS